MHSTRLPVLEDDPSALDLLWETLAPDPGSPTPRIRAVMIASVDGTTTVDGRSGGLGTPTDGLVYHGMRARADLVLVGSGTALAERYGPARISEVWSDRRSAPPPTVLVLSRTLPDALVDLCAEAGHGMEVAAEHGISTDRLEVARRCGVTVHVLGPGTTGAAVRELVARLGASEVAFEGGPSVLAQLLVEDAVDELILSTAPEIVIGGDDTPLVSGVGAVRVPMRVAAAFTCPRGGLYTRWVVKGDRG